MDVRLRAALHQVGQLTVEVQELRRRLAAARSRSPPPAGAEGGDRPSAGEAKALRFQLLAERREAAAAVAKLQEGARRARATCDAATEAAQSWRARFLALAAMAVRVAAEARDHGDVLTAAAVASTGQTGPAAEAVQASGAALRGVLASLTRAASEAGAGARNASGGVAGLVSGTWDAALLDAPDAGAAGAEPARLRETVVSAHAALAAPRPAPEVGPLISSASSAPATASPAAAASTSIMGAPALHRAPSAVAVPSLQRTASRLQPRGLPTLRSTRSLSAAPARAAGSSTARLQAAASSATLAPASSRGTQRAASPTGGRAAGAAAPAPAGALPSADVFAAVLPAAAPAISPLPILGGVLRGSTPSEPAAAVTQRVLTETMRDCRTLREQVTTLTREVTRWRDAAAAGERQRQREVGDLTAAVAAAQEHASAMETEARALAESCAAWEGLHSRTASQLTLLQVAALRNSRATILQATRDSIAATATAGRSRGDLEAATRHSPPPRHPPAAEASAALAAAAVAAAAAVDARRQPAGRAPPPPPDAGRAGAVARDDAGEASPSRSPSVSTVSSADSDSSNDDGGPAAVAARPAIAAMPQPSGGRPRPAATATRAVGPGRGGAAADEWRSLSDSSRTSSTDTTAFIAHVSALSEGGSFLAPGPTLARLPAVALVGGRGVVAAKPRPGSRGDASTLSDISERAASGQPRSRASSGGRPAALLTQLASMDAELDRMGSELRRRATRPALAAATSQAGPRNAPRAAAAEGAAAHHDDSDDSVSALVEGTLGELAA